MLREEIVQRDTIYIIFNWVCIYVLDEFRVIENI